jgi:hypothetical protein
MPVCTGQIALKRSATSKWDTLHFPLLCGHSHRECPSECKANCARACVSQRIREPFTCVRKDSRTPFYYLWYSLIFTMGSLYTIVTTLYPSTSWIDDRYLKSAISPVGRATDPREFFFEIQFTWVASSLYPLQSYVLGQTTSDKTGT